MMPETVRHTRSICPVCLRQLPARIVRDGADYYLHKTCPAHGSFSAVVWRGGTPQFETWGDYQPPVTGNAPGCPAACGLCENHLRETCCALVEITARCNLACPVCFAAAGSAGTAAGFREPSLDELAEIFRRLAGDGRTFVQLSGGEPTVREDLPDIIAAARRAGCETVQLNSNGIRLGAEPGYARALKDAGLSFVFMQFDGTEDNIYVKLRGRALLDVKKAAVGACGDCLLGVTLVPTVVPGVNDGNIGEIVAFGLSNSPAVRGVHFQPVSYFGRYPGAPSDADRITLPEILRAIEAQTNGKLEVRDFIPSACDHPRCSFHGDFVVLPDGGLLHLTSKIQKASCCDGGSLQMASKNQKASCCDSGLLQVASNTQKASCCGDAAHLKNRNFVSRRWTRIEIDPIEPENSDYKEIDTFLNRVRSHGFTITGMAFQDAWTLDLERLQTCSLHVIRGSRVVPFCAGYLTALPEDTDAAQKKNIYESDIFAVPEDMPMHPGGLRLTDRAARLAGLSPGMRTADVGCGSGASAAYLAERFGLVMTGLEISEALVEAGLKKYSGLNLIRWDGGGLPFEDGSLDAVLLECVLSLVACPEDLLAECARVLKPTGVLIVSDIVAKCCAPSGAEQHRTAEALTGLISEAGFVMEHCEDHTQALLTFAAALYQRGVSQKDASSLTGCCDGTRPKLSAMGYSLIIARKQ